MVLCVPFEHWLKWSVTFSLFRTMNFEQKFRFKSTLRLTTV